MRLNYIFIIIFLLVISNLVIGQKISNIDFDDIKMKTSDSTSEFYYPILLKQFTDDNTKMSKEEHKLVYYGYVFTKGYNPMGSVKDEADFLNYYNKKDYENAVLIGKKLLGNDPTNLTYNYRTFITYVMLSDSTNAIYYANRYVYLRETIYKSGDGLSLNTAYVVTRVSDEYQIMEHKKLELKSQALIGNCDLLEFKQPNENNIEKLYFNVKFSLGYLGKMIENNNK